MTCCSQTVQIAPSGNPDSGQEHIFSAPGSYSDPSEMDRPQPFSSHPWAFDAVFFSGASVSDGGGSGGGSGGDSGFSFVAAMERRKEERCNAVFYIKAPKKFRLLVWKEKYLLQLIIISSVFF